MEASQKIKLFGNRDFSENFDMTLNFIKSNYGQILKGIAILIPALLILAFFTPSTSSLTSVMDPSDVVGFYSSIFSIGIILVYFLSTLITYIIFLYTIAYMALYAKSSDGIVKNTEVWSKVANAFLPMIGAAIIFGFLSTIGILLCIIPGIIVYVYLGFYAYVYINEDRGIIDSFYRSYEIVSNNWWITLGYGLVFAILVGIGGVIFTIPTYLVGLGYALQIDFLSSDIFAYMATFISSVGGLLLSPILYMALGVMYYSHRNKLERIDMITEIENIGVNTDEPNNQI